MCDVGITQSLTDDFQLPVSLLDAAVGRCSVIQ